jgi:hypothetical protein
MKLEKTAHAWAGTFLFCALIFVCAGTVSAQSEENVIVAPSCERTIKADVVAFDQPFFYNRLGAVNPAGMIYALRGDVKAKSSAGLVPGNVILKDY